MQEVWHGDCLKLMKNIPDQSIDFICCDLPFEITQNKWDIMIPPHLLWEQYNRIIKPSGVIALNAFQPFTSILIASNYKMFKYEWIWVKNKSRGHLNAKKQPLRQHESIVIFYNKKPTYNPQKTGGHKPVNSYIKHTGDGDNYGKTKIGIKGGGSTERYPTTVLNFDVVNNDAEDKYHSTQKPVALCEYLIKTYTNEGDLVLDNCCGSGSTLVAAKNLGRQFIGIDKIEKYCNITRKRLGQYE